MGCNCKSVESLLAIVIIVFALWETAASMWVVIIAAVLILLHANTCKKCKVPISSAPVSNKKRKKK